jgi:hypothetical protein
MRAVAVLVAIGGKYDALPLAHGREHASAASPNRISRISVETS